MDVLVLAFLQTFVAPIGYWAGRVVVPVILFGKTRVESGGDVEGNESPQRWNEIRRDKNGKIVLSAVVGMLIGWLFLISGAMLFLYFK